MLTKNQIQYLRTCAHDKKAVVIIGSNGLSESVLNEIKTSLAHHELLKIKVNGLNRDNREEAAEQIAKEAGAELVQVMGAIVTIFRQKTKKEESAYNLPKD
ncbi:MAG: ribosome assembly RNA-binding protein YhbY [Succinivibrionaceae bacterium]|nr:ribosome assembly RNA-binding protein YhbY [Succinivibrionaceae bacterium]